MSYFPSYFRDANHRNWKIALTPAAVARVHELLGIELDVMDREPEAAAALLDDLVSLDGRRQDILARVSRLANLFYVVCQDQAAARGISDEQFGKLLFPVTDAAVKALFQELRDRYPAVGAGIDQMLPKLAKRNLVKAWRQLAGKSRGRK
jgi:hypothetical protein